MSKLSRRDFLKLVSLLPPALTFSRAMTSFASQNKSEQPGSHPNVILIVFDAMSARNLSVYGYPRDTTPNLERFASHATVYHSHNSSGNFTVPGTASLLTGTYPWTHRAINESGLVRRDISGRNLFELIGDSFHRLAFTQNIWADFLLSQFRHGIDMHLPPDTFSAADFLVGKYFKNDPTSAYRAYDDYLFRADNPPVSLLFGTLARSLSAYQAAHLSNNGYFKGAKRSNEYPSLIRIPHTEIYSIYFRLSEVFDGIISESIQLKAPSLAYFHFWSPHEPYLPDDNFLGTFLNDGYQPIPKPVHRLSDHISQGALISQRREYDEYISNIDSEIGRMLDAFDRNNIFEKSYVIITSDHGEMFERGQRAHETSLLYDPVIHIPLLISAPGQKVRQDIYSFTNSVDLLPTLLNIAGQPIPEWCEGALLPALGGAENSERSSFSVEAKRNPAFSPLRIATLAMQKGNYKMIYYTGYEQADSFELYNLVDDLEEMNDLYPREPVVAAAMKEELLEKLRTINQPYEH